ncbi:hypothetical protein AN958_00115 [Leucoagaricus sp. SymC.cos]|nr:hypothetical protein AN958_00115 [Leucoagaricus sp. SymC.cos]
MERKKSNKLHQCTSTAYYQYRQIRRAKMKSAVAKDGYVEVSWEKPSAVTMTTMHNAGTNKLEPKPITK